MHSLTLEDELNLQASRLIPTFYHGLQEENKEHVQEEVRVGIHGLATQEFSMQAILQEKPTNIPEGFRNHNHDSVAPGMNGAVGMVTTTTFTEAYR